MGTLSSILAGCFSSAGPRLLCARPSVVLEAGFECLEGRAFFEVEFLILSVLGYPDELTTVGSFGVWWPFGFLAARLFNYPFVLIFPVYAVVALLEGLRRSVLEVMSKTAAGVLTFRIAMPSSPPVPTTVVIGSLVLGVKMCLCSGAWITTTRWFLLLFICFEEETVWRPR